MKFNFLTHPLVKKVLSVLKINSKIKYLLKRVQPKCLNLTNSANISLKLAILAAKPETDH